MDAEQWPNGETRLAGIIGDPVAQVKSPAAVTNALRARGLNWVMLPMHVTSADLPTFLQGLDVLRNCSGLIATIPHKFAAFRHCRTTTPRAALLGAVNVARRNADGSWHGDMVDGLGFVNGLAAAGIDVRRRSALLVGAGGAGTAIALALLEAGVADLAIHDSDAGRVDALLALLRRAGPYRVSAKPAADPRGHTLVVNATPIGMRDDDPLPVLTEHLSAEMAVGDVITAPEVTPLLHLARQRGCATQTGTAMYFGLLDLMVAFLTQYP